MQKIYSDSSVETLDVRNTIPFKHKGKIKALLAFYVVWAAIGYAKKWPIWDIAFSPLGLGMVYFLSYFFSVDWIENIQGWGK
jgi:hypothetical protein